MPDIEYEAVLNGIKMGSIKPHNIYNADLNTSSVLSAGYYKSHGYDTPEQDQKVSTLFIDIEVHTREAPNQRFDFKTGDCPISAITIFSTNSSIFHAMIFLTDFNKDAFGITPNMTDTECRKMITDKQSDFTRRLKETKYALEDEQLQLHIFNNELQMIEYCWTLIKLDNPLIISGWNADIFDLPYLYNRLVFTNSKELACSIMSEFNFVEFRNGLVKIAEYSIMDLLRAYKPRAEGGMNYGRTLQSYSLNNVASVELGLQKYDHVQDLDTFYEQDPSGYLFYNIADVALCARLNDKLQHLELHNGIRRRVKSAFTHAMIGSSALFETFLYSQLADKGNMVRVGMGKESQYGIKVEELQQLPVMIDKKGRTPPAEIPSRDFTRITRKFDGAYVTDSYPRIIKGKKLIIDLDAASLYPSMILQHNISFDSYRIRVLPTTTYKVLGMLETMVGKEQAPPEQLFSNLHDLIKVYVNTEDLTPKGKNIRDIYYTMAYLIMRIFKAAIPMDQVYIGKSNNARIILIKYLLPLTDIMNTIHPDRESYNNFTYDCTFGRDEVDLNKKYPKIYLLKNANASSQYIEVVNVNQAQEELSKYSMVLAGVGFAKHTDHMGIFTEILQNLKILRTRYRDKSAEYPKGSVDFQLYDNKQKAIKVLMNSTYGIYGLSTFRYSSHWLAQSITTQGKMTIKIAQHITENILTRKYSQE